jgi:hypothetical protein
MRDGEGDELVVAAVEHGAGTQLLEVVGIRQLAEDDLQRHEQPPQPGRPVDRDRLLASAQRERLQHSGETQVMVGVVVREKDLLQLDKADLGAQELPLRSLRAVEQQSFTAAADQDGSRRPLRRRHRP